MNSDLEMELTDGLREHVAGVRPSPGLVAKAAAHHDRYRRRRQYALAVLAVGALTAVAAGGVATRNHRTSANPSDLGAISPKMRLIAAVDATGRTSYRITLTNTRTRPLRGGAPEVDVVKFTGTYDPGQRRGSGIAAFSNGEGTAGLHTTQVRIIGDTIYVQDRDADGNPVWGREDGTLSSVLTVNGARDLGTVDAFTVDPADLLPVLRSLGHLGYGARSAAAHGLDTYNFSQAVPAKSVPFGSDAIDDVPAHTIASTVHVDPDTGLVASFTQETTLAGAHPEVADADPITFRTTAEYTDYGTSVEVQAPPS